MAKLFTPIQIRDLQIRNRIFVSPMCQYSANDGIPNEWHHVHLGSRAVGGAGLVVVEATGVVPEGRITLGCTGLWSEKHAQAFKPIVDFAHLQKAKIAVQLAHAGRKASTHIPWQGHGALKDNEGAWQTVAPSAVRYNDIYPMPKEMSEAEIKKMLRDFVAAAGYAEKAGFDVIELHMAHGYLLHQFLSPLSNQRKDQYGGSLENRMRAPLEVAKAVREAWPKTKPLFVRLSCTDWVQGGWDPEQSVRFVKELVKVGVDLIDCSSGGLSPQQKIKDGPNYQVPFAEKIRHETGVITSAVGQITEAQQAEEILVLGKADVITMAREFLRNPYWPLHAAKTLGVDVAWPVQYERAKN